MDNRIYKAYKPSDNAFEGTITADALCKFIDDVFEVFKKTKNKVVLKYYYFTRTIKTNSNGWDEIAKITLDENGLHEELDFVYNPNWH